MFVCFPTCESVKKSNFLHSFVLDCRRENKEEKKRRTKTISIVDLYHLMHFESKSWLRKEN